ncbi:MAG: hypothetical protein LBU23_01720, partial [Planctomycetota bacterium]|nr:hypothetical protein [Planctomycetota bacterium]
VAQVHAHGLASCDLHPRNLILTPEGRVRLIDVSFKGSIIMSQAKDLTKVRKMFGMAHPIKKILLPTWRRRFLFNFVLARDFLRSTLRRWQGKL